MTGLDSKIFPNSPGVKNQTVTYLVALWPYRDPPKNWGPYGVPLQISTLCHQSLTKQSLEKKRSVHNLQFVSSEKRLPPTNKEKTRCPWLEAILMETIVCQPLSLQMNFTCYYGCMLLCMFTDVKDFGLPMALASQQMMLCGGGSCWVHLCLGRPWNGFNRWDANGMLKIYDWDECRKQGIQSWPIKLYTAPLFQTQFCRFDIVVCSLWINGAFNPPGNQRTNLDVHGKANNFLMKVLITSNLQSWDGCLVFTYSFPSQLV